MPNFELWQYFSRDALWTEWKLIYVFRLFCKCNFGHPWFITFKCFQAFRVGRIVLNRNLLYCCAKDTQSTLLPSKRHPLLRRNLLFIPYSLRWAVCTKYTLNLFALSSVQT
jgi:hypothetical protein